MKVLVLGGSGLLGAALCPVLREAGFEVLAPSSRELDIRELEALRARVADAAPDLLVNSAAQSKVDQAALEPDLTFQVNAIGAHNAAIAAAEAGIPLVHISTDYVFDGASRTPYREHDPTGVPPNEYGRSKLQAEQLVRHLWPRHFIVRVAALFGAGGRPDFVDWVLKRADPAAPLTIVSDRTMTPTWTADLARQLLALIRTPCWGTYHATGHGPASWFELAREALTLAGRDPGGVVPIADLPSPARRAPYTALDNHLLRLRGLDTMLPWREALARHLAGRR
jgi:dTDP-4-dehydrorhamnose reductase